MITVLENKETNFVDGVFPDKDETELYLLNHPGKELKLRELQFDRFPFFIILEINPCGCRKCNPIYVSYQDEVINYVKQVDLGKYTKQYDDPSDDQIFILDYIKENYSPKDKYFISHTHIYKKEVAILKRFIAQGHIARAKRDIFNFDSDFEDIEVGIFWINLSTNRIFKSITVRASDIDITNPDQYTFSHADEWENQEINNLYDFEVIKGNYDDYPYGSIFYKKNTYCVKISCQVTDRLKKLILDHFNLPAGTYFIDNMRDK
jgi:hypothetical protein